MFMRSRSKYCNNNFQLESYDEDRNKNISESSEFKQEVKLEKASERSKALRETL